MNDSFMLNWSHDKIKEVFDDNKLLARMANEQRMKLPSSPEQSEFRVYALLIVETMGRLMIIEGCNAEQGYIGGL